MKLFYLHENIKVYSKDALTSDQIQAIRNTRDIAQKLTEFARKNHGIQDAIETQQKHVVSIRERLSKLQAQHWFSEKETEQKRLEGEWDRTYKAFLKLKEQHERIIRQMKELKLEQEEIGVKHDDLFNAILYRGQGDLYWV